MDGPEYLQKLCYVECWKRDYRPLDKEFPFIAAFIDANNEHQIDAPMTRARRDYSEIVTDVTDDTWQRVWSKDELCGLKRRAKEFKRSSVESFEKHIDSVLYSLKSHLLYHTVKDI